LLEGLPMVERGHVAQFASAAPAISVVGDWWDDEAEMLLKGVRAQLE